MNLSAYGITTELPPGWEGRITKRTEPTPGTQSRARGSPGEVTSPVAHLGNFALPEDRGDFGSGAVDLMGDANVFVCLFEYGPEGLGQELFARKGLPRRLTPNLFSPNRLQRSLPGQAGAQLFFTESNRPFCLYVVLGNHRGAAGLVPLANDTLQATRIDPR